jgi:hypothetical protein
MANMEIQHVLITLKPQNQWWPRGNRWCVRYRRLFGTSPVRDTEFTVAGLRNTTNGEEFGFPVRRGRVDRSSVRDSGDMHSLGGSTGLP